MRAVMTIKVYARLLLRECVNELLKGTKLMGLADDINAVNESVGAIAVSVAAVDVKLDSVREEILALRDQIASGTPPVEVIDALTTLAASVDALKSHSAAVADEAAALP